MRLAVAALLALAALALAQAFAQDGTVGGIGSGQTVGGIGGGMGAVTGTVGAAPAPPSGAILMVDGVSNILQTDGTSNICLAGATC